MIEMMEINGHFIDAQKISYISPIRKSTGGVWISEEKNYDWCSFHFSVVVDTEHVLLEFEDEDAARAVRIRCIKGAR